MKKIISLLLILTITLLTTSCATVDRYEVPYGKTAEFEDGLCFSVERHVFKDNVKAGIYNYSTTPDNIYLLIEIKVTNNTDKTYYAYGTEIWLDWNGVKISQVDIVKNFVDGFYSLSQMPTLTKYYTATFEISKDIPISELRLVFERREVMRRLQLQFVIYE